MTNLRNADNGLVKRAQLDKLCDELHELKIWKEVSRCRMLKYLYPLFRDDNLVLVGGRFNNTKLAEEQRHPMILPPKHHVIRLIFEAGPKNF